MNVGYDTILQLPLVRPHDPQPSENLWPVAQELGQLGRNDNGGQEARPSSKLMLVGGFPTGEPASVRLCPTKIVMQGRTSGGT